MFLLFGRLWFKEQAFTRWWGKDWRAVKPTSKSHSLSKMWLGIARPSIPQNSHRHSFTHGTNIIVLSGALLVLFAPKVALSRFSALQRLTQWWSAAHHPFIPIILLSGSLVRLRQAAFSAGLGRPYSQQLPTNSCCCCCCPVQRCSHLRHPSCTAALGAEY